MNPFSVDPSETPEFKNNLRSFLVAYFIVLFNYPLIRASTTTLFFNDYGAKSTPMAWLGSVVVLIIAVSLCNGLQKKLRAPWVFLGVGLFSFLVFGSALLTGPFFPFVWKEIYIVLQVHILLAYANSYFSKEDFKKLVGPIGAVGSLGGVLGGLLTTFLSQTYGTEMVIAAGALLSALPTAFFFLTEELKEVRAQEQRTSPLASLKSPGIRAYVLTIALIVALGQFVINIADFNFNLAFEKSVVDPTLRTSYLGSLYTWMNGLTFIFQFALVPIIVPRVRLRNIHLAIPLFYLAAVFGLGWGSGLGLVSVAGFYTFLKATDYSFFSAGKELLYQPLSVVQKYGAKYLTDMLSYRLSKAMIAAVLIYVQSSTILNSMMVVFLILWVIMVIRLFRYHRNLFS